MSAIQTGVNGTGHVHLRHGHHSLPKKRLQLVIILLLLELSQAQVAHCRELEGKEGRAGEQRSAEKKNNEEGARITPVT